MISLTSFTFDCFYSTFSKAECEIFNIKSLLAQLLKVMNLESSPLADVFERYNTAKLTTVIDEDDEGMEIRRHFAFADGSHEDQKTSKKFNIESDFDVSIILKNFFTQVTQN